METTKTEQKANTELVEVIAKACAQAIAGQLSEVLEAVKTVLGDKSASTADLAKALARVAERLDAVEKKQKEDKGGVDEVKALLLVNNRALSAFGDAVGITDLPNVKDEWAKRVNTAPFKLSRREI